MVTGKGEPMDAGQAWTAEPEDLEEPETEPEYWEDDELTPEELSAWSAAVHAAERADAAAGSPRSEACAASAWPHADGSVPDLIAAALAAGGEPGVMTDAQLLDSLAGWHAVAARAAGRELRATEELLRRRKPRVWDRRADRAQTRREDLDGAVPGQPASATGGPGGVAVAPERAMPAVVASREAAAEIALVLTATEYSAQVQAELAADLSRRLPAAFAELEAGRADLRRVRVLAEGTQLLSDQDAGRVDALLAGSMGQMTTTDLKEKTRRAVIKIDPGAADRRRERAERKARFALYGNDDQTATAAVERMPSHLGAAVKARVNAIARAARAAGMTGPLPLLEAKVATGLLLDTLPHIPPPADGGSQAGTPPGAPQDPGPAGDPWPDGWPTGWFTGPDAPAPGGGNGPDAPAPGGGSRPDAPAPGRGSGPAVIDPPPDPGPDDDSVNDPVPGDGQPDVAAGPDPDGPDGGDLAEPDRDGVHIENGPPDASGAMTWPRIPAQAGAAAPGCRGLPAWLRPKVPGRIRLTVPWRTLAGTGPEPGDLSWTGPITPAQARELAAAAATDPACTWRLIVTDDNGRAVAITTVRTRRGTGTGPPGLVSEVTLTITRSLAAALSAQGPSADRPGHPLAWLTSTLNQTSPGHSGTPGHTEADPGDLAQMLTSAIPAANRAAAQAAARATADQAAGGCAHTMQAPGYRVPDRLRRWLNTRDRTCRNPICRQPAARSDQDHTLPYHRGGRTCPCNLGGLCRRHHGLKQLPGWQLTQDAQGHFTWRTPAGLTYREKPCQYPV